MGGKVAAGNMEIADDMTLCRFGMTHRWQTKRGPVGHRHIIDWITLSTHFNYYPESEYNFGQSVGLIDYDFLWHVGDRFSLFSSGLYDTFSEGQRITRIGGMWNRPQRGNFSAALDQLDGLIERTYLTLSVGYTMNEKYSMSYTTSYDIKDKWQNVGHVFMFTRTGEAFRFFVGATYSEAREDWSFTFGLEPVFMRGIAAKMSQMSTQAQQVSNR
jgi:lipopolysaccharide assembly outer membrane protein LptD (OstA)